MLDKYDRTVYMPIVMGKERDMILSNWDLFEIKRPIRYDTIKRQDIYRPDLLSIRIYGSVSFWWIISKVNNIDDWWNDVFVGKDIIIPDKNDISDFNLKIKTRQLSLES